MMLGLVVGNPGFVLAVISALASIVSGNKCTNVLRKTDIVEVVIKEPCIQKHTARCGWLSLNYCTFYNNMYCDKKVNETVTTYYIQTECCKGFVMASNGTCIKMRPGVVYDTRTTPVSLGTKTAGDPHYKHESMVAQSMKEVKMEISGGGYAGIACGLVLIVTIVAFVIIAVRKRKKKKQQLEAHLAEKVIYVGPMTGEQPIVRRAGNSRTPSIQFSREATPSSSKMVTPPTSPVKTTHPVEMPLINRNLADEDIPESNV